MRLSDFPRSSEASKFLDDHPKEGPIKHDEDGKLTTAEEHHLGGAVRFMTLQNKVIAMMPEDLFPKSATEMLALNNLIYDNVKGMRADIPRDVITRWENMAPKRKEREVENPYNYT